MSKKCEKEAMEDPEEAYYYARKIIEGRWYQAELTIMKNPWYAYWYAREVIKGRWPEAEPVILNSSCAQWYNDFLSTLS